MDVVVDVVVDVVGIILVVEVKVDVMIVSLLVDDLFPISILVVEAKVDVSVFVTWVVVVNVTIVDGVTAGPAMKSSEFQIFLLDTFLKVLLILWKNFSIRCT